MLFSFPFQINWFYWSTGKRGTRNKKRCNWAGLYRRWLLSRSSRCSFDTVILVIILLQKTVVCHPAVVLSPDRLTHGGPLDDWRRLTGFVESVCGCCVRRASMCVCVCMWVWVSWMRGFTSVPLSLWGRVPPTLVRACPCGRLHLQTPNTQPIRQRHTLIISQQVIFLKQCCNT